jgi:hypothetical protein
MASRGQLYDSHINNYWSHFIKYIKKIKIFLLFDSPDINGLDIDKEDTLYFDHTRNATSYINSNGHLKHVLKKILDCFEYIENNYEYKHLLGTNLSSFFIIDELIKIHNLLNYTDVDAGVFGNINFGVFISGAGRWLSSDNIKFILLNKNNIDFKYVDDVAISILLINIKYV